MADFRFNAGQKRPEAAECENALELRYSLIRPTKIGPTKKSPDRALLCHGWSRTMSEMAPTPRARLPEMERPLVLDGGLATELEARGVDLTGPLWSARLLLENPRLIRDVHDAYLRAGADCIVTASYQATIPGFTSSGLTEANARQALVRSVTLAVEARDAFWMEERNRKGRIRPFVAASVGPYGAYLANGAEYTGDYDLDDRGVYRFHAPRFRLLAGAGADLLACETIPSRAETLALFRLFRETPEAQGWISWSCADGAHLRDGTPIGEVAALANGTPGVLAVGVNCTEPAHITPLIERMRRMTDLPLVVYPNSGERYDPRTGRWQPGGGRPDLAALAVEWVGAGARIVGGCCRTTPADIAAIRSAIDSARSRAGARTS